ncbi:hypothetical protein NEAUS04_0202 [Nematocida ausubeli]|nr:hypothetical protein NEAUS04_0202 [Nematocida ausubeli]
MKKIRKGVRRLAFILIIIVLDAHKKGCWAASDSSESLYQDITMQLLKFIDILDFTQSASTSSTRNTSEDTSIKSAINSKGDEEALPIEKIGVLSAYPYSSGIYMGSPSYAERMANIFNNFWLYRLAVNVNSPKKAIEKFDIEGEYVAYIGKANPLLCIKAIPASGEYDEREVIDAAEKYMVLPLKKDTKEDSKSLKKPYNRKLRKALKNIVKYLAEKYEVHTINIPKCKSWIIYYANLLGEINSPHNEGRYINLALNNENLMNLKRKNQINSLESSQMQEQFTSKELQIRSPIPKNTEQNLFENSAAFTVLIWKCKNGPYNMFFDVLPMRKKSENSAFSLQEYRNPNENMPGYAEKQMHKMFILFAHGFYNDSLGYILKFDAVEVDPNKPSAFENLENVIEPPQIEEITSSDSNLNESSPCENLKNVIESVQNEEVNSIDEDPNNSGIEGIKNIIYSTAPRDIEDPAETEESSNNDEDPEKNEVPVDKEAATKKHVAEEGAAVSSPESKHISSPLEDAKDIKQDDLDSASFNENNDAKEAEGTLHNEKVHDHGEHQTDPPQYIELPSGSSENNIIPERKMPLLPPLDKIQRISPDKVGKEADIFRNVSESVDINTDTNKTKHTSQDFANPRKEKTLTLDSEKKEESFHPPETAHSSDSEMHIESTDYASIESSNSSMHSCIETAPSVPDTKTHSGHTLKQQHLEKKPEYSAANPSIYTGGLAQTKPILEKYKAVQSMPSEKKLAKKQRSLRQLLMCIMWIALILSIILFCIFIILIYKQQTEIEKLNELDADIAVTGV